MTTTNNDIESAFARLARNMMRNGDERAEELRLHHGSPSNGRAWRIFRQGSFGGQLDAGFSLDRGWIGNTKREAELTLLALSAGYAAALDK